MKPKTMILMVVAVACGLGASYMTSKLLADRQETAPVEELVPVLMAKVKVPGWTPIKEPEKFFEVKMLPESAVSKSSLKGFDDVKDQRLNKPLEAERVALQGDLLSKEQQSLADSLAPGMRAIAVKVTPESLSGGFVLQGARVDVVCTTRSSDPSAKIFLQGMLVLAVDTQDTRNPEQKSILAQTVTLAATPEEATRLSLAATVGELRLLPKSHGDTKRMANIVTRLADLDKPLPASDGSREAETTPPVTTVTTPLPEIKEPIKQTPAVVEKPKKRHVMTLINGTSREKAVFIEGEDEEGNVSSTPARKEDKPEPKPEVEKEQPKTQPTTPVAPTATTKTSRTRRS
jgi:Flp pilus assembly protein CpaB